MFCETVNLTLFLACSFFLLFFLAKIKAFVLIKKSVVDLLKKLQVSYAFNDIFTFPYYTRRRF